MSPRPDVLGYPSPTTSRYVILAAALLASGLFVGNWAHNQLRGDQWLRTVLACQIGRTPTSDLQEQLRAEKEFEGCTADVERTRAGFALGGMVVAGGAAAVVMFVAPVVVVRRRRLRRAGPALAGAVERFGELAREAGIEQHVRPLVGTARQRDAFSFGSPGRYRVALPPAVAVRWRDARLFDPLVRHELAHVRQRDVSLAWLTRSVWYALVPILALPAVAALVDGDRSLLGDYLWRAALLGGVVALLSAALLRSREYVADLRAARWQGDPAAVEAVVGTARPGPPDAFHRLLAKHPSPGHRVDVLRSPGLLVRSGFLDGLVGAFLGGLTVPLVVSGLSPLLSASTDATASYLVASLVLGPVLGASVGLAVWRDALFARVTGDDPAAGGVACGVGIGLVGGQAVSLGGTTTGLSAGFGHPAWLLVSAVAGVGVTIMSAGLAQLWTDAAPRLASQRACWVAALVVNAVLFTVLLWSTSLFQVAADGGGWALGRSELTLHLASWPMFWTVLGLALLGALPVALGRSARSMPDWLVEVPEARGWRRVVATRQWVTAVGMSLATGLLAVAVIVAYRVGAGRAPSGALAFERFQAYQWVVALAAAVAVAAIVLLGDLAGPGLVATVLPLTAALGSAGWLVLNLSLGAPFDFTVLMLMLRPATVLGWYVALVVLPIVYAPTRLPRLPRKSVRLPMAVATASVATVVIGSIALDQREHLVPPAEVGASVLTQPLGSGSGDAGASYLAEVAPLLTRQYAAVEQFTQGVLTDPSTTPAEKADAIEQQVEPTVSALVVRWAAYRPGSAEVARVHAIALSALRTAALKYQAAVQALRTQDQASVAEVSRLDATEKQLWAQWHQRQAALGGG
jgi:hypothetical protein